MLRKTILEQVSASSFVAGDLLATRPLALLAPLFAGLPLAASSSAAKASKLDPAETIIALPDAIRFIPWSGAPAQSGAVATLYGGLDNPGPYLVHMKWYPGYMSAPHSYATDRLSLVLSATWWGNGAPDFHPNHTAPLPARALVPPHAPSPHS